MSKVNISHPFVQYLLTLPVAAWFAMLWIGVLHGHIEQVPATGYWVTFLLRMIVSGLSAAHSYDIAIYDKVKNLS